MDRGRVTAEQGDVREQPTEGAGETMPPVPDSVREAARMAPDHWLGMVDPAWNGEDELPPWAMIGQWRENEDYRPSPSALGWPKPTDDVDAAMQLAATGYGPGEAVTDALAALPEVAVFIPPRVIRCPPPLRTAGRGSSRSSPLRRTCTPRAGWRSS
jgi:hypothetical protein